MKAAVLSYLPWIACGVSLLLSVTLLFVFKKLHDRLEEMRSDLQRLEKKIAGKGSKIDQSAKASQNDAALSEYEALRRRVDVLQGRMEEHLSQPLQKPTALRPNPPRSENRQGYFGQVIPSGGVTYFKTFETSKSSETYFVARGTERCMEFELVNLAAAQAYDRLDAAIEYTGVSPQQAIRMRTLKPGIAVFEGGKWIVKDKTKVRLS